MDEKMPKIFVSYAWTDAEHEARVIELCERLLGNGIDVVFDKWDLNPGQDKYVFMEQSVNNTGIDKVLLICNKEYKEKANSRTGGVGDETTIISQEVYSNNNQKKFIPIIFEKDEKEEAFVPTYVRAKIYIDLSNEETYENKYEELVRAIYEVPLNRKPAIGKKPEWLNDCNVSTSYERGIIKQISSNGGNSNKVKILLKSFGEAFYEKSDEFKIDRESYNGASVKEKIDEMIILRELFVEYLIAIFELPENLGDTLGNFFEDYYNHIAEFSESNMFREKSNEQFKFLYHELFLIMTAYLIYYERYSDLKEILSRTYFLKESMYTQKGAYNYASFRSYLPSLDEDFKKTTEWASKITYSGELLISRAKNPIATKENLVVADILLCQLSYINCPQCTFKYEWFPTIYIYLNQFNRNVFLDFCKKFISKKFCTDIMMLFNASDYNELKEILSKNKVEKGMRYNGAWDSCPSIIDYINTDEIASL